MNQLNSNNQFYSAIKLVYKYLAKVCYNKLLCCTFLRSLGSFLALQIKPQLKLPTTQSLILFMSIAKLTSKNDCLKL